MTEPDTGGKTPGGDPDPHPEIVAWQDITSQLLRGAAELRGALRIDEWMLARLAPSAHAHPRDFVLAQALDEVHRTAVATLRWEEFIGDGSNPPDDPDAPPGLNRVILEGVQGEQTLRLRCLVEALIALICASTVDEEPYWRHWVLLTQLGDLRSQETDLVEFFACPSGNLAWQTAHLAEEIAELEASGAIDLGAAWYLNRQPTAALSAERLMRVPPGAQLSSTRARLKFAVSCATPEEALIIGTSYVRYSRLSRAAHFLPVGADPDLSIGTIVGRLRECILAAMNLLVRVRVLLGEPPGEASAFVADALAGADDVQPLLRRQTVGRAETGDVVLAQGRLALVRQVHVSDYGYRSYGVRFLQSSPLPHVPEDCVPASEAGLVLERASVADVAKRAISLLPEGSVVRSRFAAARDEERDGLVHAALVDAWEAGLGKFILRGGLARDWKNRPAAGEAVEGDAAEGALGGDNPPV